ncbi:MAG: BolA/IbaG family iron-sulfur metabolism protein [Alcanivoracaceae bacterium]|nr:BolA/IbaG family iron-sulfur metabolism protein [Alcanivoracaceae bacterium]
MSVATEIELKVRAGLVVEHLGLENESHMHNVAPGSETHFRLVVVSPDFEGVILVRRHQRIYALLDEELKAGVHALALHTFTPEEWRARQGDAAASPKCLGGNGK